jgi:hypothetical protein
VQDIERRPFKLAQEEIPEDLRGNFIQVYEPNDATLDEIRLLVEDGKDTHIASLARQQHNIVRSRWIKDAANSDEVTALRKAGKIAEACKLIEETVNARVYGSRGPVTPESAEKKLARNEGASMVARIRAAHAAGDKKTLDTARSLGVDVDGIVASA